MKSKNIKLIATFITLLLYGGAFLLSGSIYQSIDVNAAKFNSKKVKNKVKAKYEETANGILATYKNNSNFTLNITPTIKFTDNNGTVIKVEKINNAAFSPKKTMIHIFEYPKNDTGTIIGYNTYKTSFSIKKSKYKDYTSKIDINAKLNPVDTNVLVINSAPKNLTSINASFVFYNNSNSIIKIIDQNITCTTSGTSQNIPINMSQFNETPTKVKIYKNWAY